VASTTCSGSTCVATACAAGFKTCATGCCPKWTVETIPGITYNFYGISLAFDAANTPFVATVQGSNILLAKKINGSWTVSTVVPGFSPSLKLDSLGRPRIAFRRTTGIYYAAFSGTSWAVYGVDTSSSSLYDPSLALDAQGNPVVAYFNNDTNDLKVARKTGTTWVVETPDAAGDVGRSPSVAVAPSGDLHVVYLDYTNSRVKHGHNPASAWSLQTLQPSSITHRPGITMDGSGAAHIVYGSSYTLRYALWNGSTYTTSTVDPRGWTQGSGFSGSTPSIALTPTGTPGRASVAPRGKHRLLGVRWASALESP
jgi:hypothetical protein